MLNAIRKYKSAVFPLLIGAAMFARGLNLYMNPASNPGGWTTSSGISVEGVGMLVLSLVLIGFGMYKILK